jgi:hypothetical protein
MKMLMPKITMLFLMLFLTGGQLWGNPLPLRWELISNSAPEIIGYKYANGIIFGGQDSSGQFPNGTWWSESGIGWVQHDITGPGGRIGHGLGYNAQYRNVLLFGGRNQAGEYLGDTWIFMENHTWVKIDSTGPAPRAYFAMTYDSDCQSFFLFGGIGYDSLLRDTWEWNGSNGWVLRTTDGPPPRINAGFALDQYVDRTSFLFGGRAGFGGLVYNDAWNWNETTWTEIQPDSIWPSPRIDFAMEYAGGPGILLFGGRDAANPDSILDEAWSFKHGFNGFEARPWRALDQPPTRAGALLVRDYGIACRLMGGTDGNQNLRDIWNYPTWQLNYVTGDINNNHVVNTNDIVNAVNYLRGFGPPPGYSIECCDGHRLYAAGDVNASCTFDGVDVTYLVAYFKGGPLLHPCSRCAPTR